MGMSGKYATVDKHTRNLSKDFMDSVVNKSVKVEPQRSSSFVTPNLALTTTANNLL